MANRGWEPARVMKPEAPASQQNVSRSSSRNLALFVDFVLSKLTDSRFVKSKKSADLFLDSIQEEEWYWQAVSLMATKFLEHLYYTSSLKSKTAYALIDCTLKNRLMLEKMGKLFGRIAKNN